MISINNVDIDHIELTTRIIDGNITFPYQNEIENLALETIGTIDV